MGNEWMGDRWVQMSAPLGLELKRAVSHSKWVLGTEPGFLQDCIHP